MKMARQDEYKASLTREQFLFYEIRVVAKLRMQGETSDGSLKKVLEDNLFQFPTERMDNIQHIFSDIPVLMLYPGKFDGQDLDLFGRFLDGHYYRAFNLL